MYAFALGLDRFTENVSLRSRTRSPTTATVIVLVLPPAGNVRVPLTAWKSDGVVADVFVEVVGLVGVVVVVVLVVVDVVVVLVEYWSACAELRLVDVA